MLRSLLTFILVMFASGCSEAPVKPAGQDDFRVMAIHYGQFLSSHKGQAPKDEAEFKGFLREKGAKVDVDKAFVSARDGQPLVVRYGAKGGSSSIVIHEKTGTNGKRLVALMTSEVKEMTDAEFQAATSK